MTITYPRDLPAFYFGGGRIGLKRNDLMTPDGAGTISGVQLGHPVLVWEYDIVAITDDQAVAWEAWIESLKGQAEGFLAHDLRRPYPKAYLGSGSPNFTGAALPATRHDASPFDGSAASYSLDGTRMQLTLNGLPSTFAFKAGDWIGFKGGSGNLKRAMVKVMEDVTASAGVAVANVNPAVRAVVDTWSSVKAHVDAPACTMKLMPETQIGDTDVNGQMTGRIVGQQYFPE